MDGLTIEIEEIAAGPSRHATKGGARNHLILCVGHERLRRGGHGWAVEPLGWCQGCLDDLRAGRSLVDEERRYAERLGLCA